MVLRRTVEKLLRGITRWSIGVYSRPIGKVIEDLEVTDKKWVEIGDKSFFLADPFPVILDGDSYILFEVYKYEDEKGHIGYIEYDSILEGEHSVNDAHEESFHMSYPYVLDIENEKYVIPETSEAGQIRMYKMESISEWKLENVIINDVQAIDPTITRYRERWWLFCTIKPKDNKELHVYYTDNPKGSWRPHRHNPVKEDIRSSRPAGKPFINNGCLFRPSQCCTPEYGTKIVVNRVQSLTTESFKENKAFEITPKSVRPGSSGVHTLSYNEQITCIDSKQWVHNREYIRHIFRTVSK